MPKPKLGYLLFDLPSDHEVEGALATECQTIEAILHNKGMPARVKRIRVASQDRFMNYPTYKYKVQFVHLACHGGTTGIGMLGGSISWEKVAKQITRHLHPLKDTERRVICFSCCHSLSGFNKTTSEFSKHFTGAYLFHKARIPFAQAITTWSMFYYKKDLNNPHKAIIDTINNYYGEKVIAFKTY